MYIFLKYLGRLNAVYTLIDNLLNLDSEYEIWSASGILIAYRLL